MKSGGTVLVGHMKYEVKSGIMHEIIVRALDEMQMLGPQIENRLEKLIRVWRALHEYVNFVHDPDYRTVVVNTSIPAS